MPTSPLVERLRGWFFAIPWGNACSQQALPLVKAGAGVFLEQVATLEVSRPDTADHQGQRMANPGDAAITYAWPMVMCSVSAKILGPRKIFSGGDSGTGNQNQESPGDPQGDLLVECRKCGRSALHQGEHRKSMVHQVD